MNVPKLRFKEFTDEWSNKKLNEIVKFSKGNILSKADLNNEGKYPCILYGQLYTKYHEVIKEIVGRTDRNNKNIIKSKYGDILIPSSGESPIDISTASCVLFDNVLIGGDINILSPINSDGRFMSYMISNNKKFEIAKVAQGHSIVHLYNENLKSIKLAIPSKAEQTKIANFLSLLDKKIELQTKKIEDLKLYKKGLLEKQFNENYQEISLKNILKERKEYSEKGLEYPHVTLSKDGIYDKGERYNRDFLVKSNSKEYKITKLNDLCYNPANLKFGVICLNEYGSAIFSPIYITFEINKIANPLYIKYYTSRNNFINAARKYEQGTVYERMSVSPEDFLKFSIKLPKLATQNKIVKRITNFDKKIDLEEKKLIKLQELKKGLMQSMFV